MPKFVISIMYETDGLDGESDHLGIADDLGKAFPAIARPYVMLKTHITVLKLPTKKTRKSRR